MIKIEKHISLGFLGSAYDNSYVIFQAIPMREYLNMQAQVAKLQSDENNQEAMKFMVELLGEHFVSGEIDQGGSLKPITKDDLLDLPGEFFINAMAELTGQSPKD